MNSPELGQKIPSSKTKPLQKPLTPNVYDSGMFHLASSHTPCATPTIFSVGTTKAIPVPGW
jgi:hypothetical protein